MRDDTPGPLAVFLHSGFRAGSTWFWSRFRAAAGTYAYYEPFSEALRTLRLDSIAAYKPRAWASGHPALDAPYYQEYAPLLGPEGGVQGFHSEFSYTLYYNRDPHEPQQAYIELLIRHAMERGCVPVLGFCRSYGRVPWLREHFDGVHIVTVRNPRDQWLSYCRQLELDGNTYFQFVAYTVAAVGHFGGRCGDAFQDLPLPDLSDVPPEARGDALCAFFDTLDNAQRCRVFLRVFTVDMLIALGAADLVVDMDRLSGDGTYRRDATARLRAMTGLGDLCFDDCALPRTADVDVDAGWAEAVDRERASLRRFAAGAPLLKMVTGLLRK